MVKWVRVFLLAWTLLDQHHDVCPFTFCLLYKCVCASSRLSTLVSNVPRLSRLASAPVPLFDPLTRFYGTVLSGPCSPSSPLNTEKTDIPGPFDLGATMCHTQARICQAAQQSTSFALNSMTLPTNPRPGTSKANFFFDSSDGC